ncbi:MAG: hypothetical protein JSS89_12190 [Bacteroidetes bacterium]|nr:hypothetical protein [Bacteroidota bacterium]
MQAASSSRSRPSSAATPVRIEIECDAGVWERSLLVAMAQVGVVERTGHNDGRQVEAYQRSVALGSGNPYCWAGQYWSFLQVTPAPPILKTGLCSAGWSDALRRGTATVYRVQRGDLLVWKHLGGPQGHVERSTTDELRGGWVRTVAFNTTSGSAGDQRDGGGVYLRARNIRHPLGRMILRGSIGRREHDHGMGTNMMRVIVK